MYQKMGKRKTVPGVGVGTGGEVARDGRKRGCLNLHS